MIKHLAAWTKQRYCGRYYLHLYLPYREIPSTSSFKVANLEDFVSAEIENNSQKENYVNNQWNLIDAMRNKEVYIQCEKQTEEGLLIDASALVWVIYSTSKPTSSVFLRYLE